MITNNYRNFMKLLFYNILFMMVISACSFIPGGMTPGDAVRDTLPSPDFQIALVRQFEEGTVVLYHNPQFVFIPGDPQNPVFQLGYSYVERQGLRWRVRGGVSGSFTPEQGSKIIFLLDQVQSGAQNPKMNKPDDLPITIIVFGKVLDPAIETVEVILVLTEFVVAREAEMRHDSLKTLPGVEQRTCLPVSVPKIWKERQERTGASCCR